MILYSWLQPSKQSIIARLRRKERKSEEGEEDAESRESDDTARSKEEDHTCENPHKGRGGKFRRGAREWKNKELKEWRGGQGRRERKKRGGGDDE